MNKNYFVQKKMRAVFSYYALYALKAVVRFSKFVFAKRTILFVTNQKIRSISLGPISQICILFSLAYVGNLFMQSLRFDKVISEKTEEISRLKTTNSYFEEEFTVVNEKLQKVNEYLIAITGDKHQVSAPEKTFKQPQNIKDETLSKPEKRTLNEVKNANYALDDIQNIARVRIKQIEDAINTTGLNFKKPAVVSSKKSREEKVISLNDKKHNMSAHQGGPLAHESDPLEVQLQTAEEEDLDKKLAKAQFDGEFNQLMFLEKLTTAIPLSRPMKNFYVSSGFGGRADPLTHGHAVHKGLDFVGPKNAKILSPSIGKVVLAGKFSGYGNAVVIDHGYGITTRYGHLSSINVSIGQTVTKNQVIATQGSTGRSTGDHLHYEVRYKNTPLNPKKFLEAGDSLFKFNDDKTPRYVNS